MTDQNVQPISLRFDEAESFADNCEAFFERLKEVDAEMATILRGNWDAIVAIVHDGERDSKTRGELNAKVASALDALVAKPVEPKGDA